MQIVVHKGDVVLILGEHPVKRGMAACLIYNGTLET